MYINHNPKIYILSGKAKSGKNEVADIISNHLSNSIQISYAHYLKEYVKKISDWDGNENTKPRDLLQSLGIDLIQKIDPNFLINRVIEDILVYSYFFDYIIITDARLINEVKMIKDKFDNAVSIRINRPNFDNNLTLDQQQHITEVELDNYNFDYTIINDGDLESKVLEVIYA